MIPDPHDYAADCYAESYRSARSNFNRECQYRGFIFAMCGLWDLYCLEMKASRLPMSQDLALQLYAMACARWSLYVKLCDQYADNWDPEGIPF